MVTDPFLVGVFYGFVPAMGFLYILLHEYQLFFNEKRVFRLFFVGMIAGALVTVAEQFMSPTVVQLFAVGVRSIGDVAVLALFAGLIGLLEVLVFAAVLNWRSMRGRRDTPFYGVAFGVGFGGMHVIVLVFLILKALELSGTEATARVLNNVLLLSLLGLYFMGGILVHGALGAWVGQGTATGPLPSWIARAAFVRATYEGLFYAVMLARPALVANALPVLGVAFGVWLIARVLRDLLDHVVPPEVLREMGIHHRRLARRSLREERGPPP